MNTKSLILKKGLFGFRKTIDYPLLELFQKLFVFFLIQTGKDYQ